MTMKKYIIGGAAIILLLILVVSAKNILIGGNNAGGNTGIQEDSYTKTQTTDLAAAQNTVTNTASENPQSAKLALVDFSYKLTPNKLVKGVPVRIEVDASTLSGCMKTVVIRDFGITKYIKSDDNIIEFTPDKTGIFWITCSMGMGAGSFEIVNPDGTSDSNTANVQATPPKSAGGSCGAGGGGCGCGGR